MNRRALLAVAVLAVLHAGSAAAADDAPMRELSRRGGCTLCHEVPVRPDAVVKRPLAPAWREVAARYAADPDAEDKLVRIVLSGSGPLPRNLHWRGEIYLGDMPNNDVQISAADARALVRWILATPH